ncbi:TnsD family Tn7-like transposition protein [Paenibacillus rigui]|uniref:Uncharacterized protein n=1 Tax=Paenibacillus rigui TaxID=554312 RepID=A0A229UUF5_9BACL|nr:TnsD family Tn7-like transposition protein [Paenibacillus rigui]OXM87014.1 hypothetical protein CF651_07135 [Paenibacillus rigui]
MSLLAFFPQPYPDEDFRSVIYRYHVHSGNQTMAHTRLELFNLNSNKNPLLPRNLKYLDNQLPPSFRLKEIIENHTVMRYIGPFLSTTERQSLWNQILNENNPNLGAFSGSYLLSKRMRYCPSCLSWDYESLGECYAHLTHQMDVLEFCPVHCEKLFSHCPKCNVELSSSDNDSLLSSPRCQNGHHIKSLQEFNEHILKSDLNIWALEFIGNCTVRNRKELIDKINLWLGEKGYFTLTGGKLFRKRLADDIIHFYGDEKLKLYDIPTEYIRSNTTMERMLSCSEKNSTNFNYYLLLFRFLAGSIKTFFSDKPTYALPIPFGNGPWTCFNKMCPQYNQYKIDRCRRHDDRGLKIVNEFQCGYCGFTYKKAWYWPERKENNRIFISSMGEYFREEVYRLHANGVTISQIAKQLNTKYVTVSKQCNTLLNQMEIQITESQVCCTKEQINKFNIYREKIMDNLKIMKEPKRSLLRKACPIAYDWLLSNDKVWMEKTLPPSMKNSEKIDWNEFDDELCHVIEKTATYIYSTDPPYRITRGKIIRFLPTHYRNRIRRSPQKMKNSNIKLEDLTEKVAHFQIRFLPQAVQRIKEKDRRVTMGSIKKHFPTIYGGISDELGLLISSKVSEIIDRGY